MLAEDLQVLFCSNKVFFRKAFLEEVGKERAPRGQASRQVTLGGYPEFLNNKHYTQKRASFLSGTLGQWVHIDRRLSSVDTNR